jgi:prophage tail gpP-like protein
MAEDNRLRVFAGGKVLEVWKSASVGLGIEQIAGRFSLELGRTPGDAGRIAGGPPLEPGQEVRVAIGDETVLVGAVDELQGRRGAGDRGYVAAGRSLTGDLVDCSAAALQMRGRTAADIVRALALPFGIDVRADAAAVARKVTNFEVELGEKAAEAILRLCRDEGLLAFAEADGSLRLARDPVTGRAAVALRHLDGPDGTPDPANNVIATSFSRGIVQRFSTITVKSQRQAEGADFGIAAAQGEGIARDAAVTRHRPLIVLADSAGDSVRAGLRAGWEVARRQALGLSLSHTVRGWRQKPGGALWSPGLLVRVDDVIAGAHRDLLITAVDFRFDGNGGRTAGLTLAPPAAFQPLPEQAADGERQKWDRVRKAVADD